MKRISVILISIGIVFLFASAAAATKGTPHKVTLCHRTASYSNPYVVITVDIASVLKTHGHDSHNGGVFYPSIPKHEKWGDIIPAFDYGPGKQYAGQNLNAEGQAILDNGCVVTSPTTTTSEATTTTGEGTTTSVEQTTTTEEATTTSTEETTTTEEVTTTLPESTTSGSVVGTTVVDTIPPTTDLGVGTTFVDTTVPFSGNATSRLAETGSNSVPLMIIGAVLLALGLFLVRRR